jgi:hypothetical protein
MPRFPLPSRPGSELGEPLLDALLDGQTLPPDAPEQARTVAEMLADLAGPAEPGELAGEAAARSAFARCPSPAGVSPPARRSGRRRSWPSRSPRLAAALIAAAVGLGGTAAAYAGVLPGPVQDFAHHLIGAPPAHGADRPKLQSHNPGRGQPGEGQPGGRKAHHTPGAATRGQSKGHGTPLPSQKHGKAKGHSKPVPPGKAKSHGKPGHRASGRRQVPGSGVHSHIPLLAGHIGL